MCEGFFCCSSATLARPRPPRAWPSSSMPRSFSRAPRSCSCRTSFRKSLLMSRSRSRFLEALSSSSNTACASGVLRMSSRTAVLSSSVCACPSRVQYRILSLFLSSSFVNSKFSYCNTCTSLFSHCCRSLIGRMDRISFSVAMHLFGSWKILPSSRCSQCASIFWMSTLYLSSFFASSSSSSASRRVAWMPRSSLSSSILPPSSSSSSSSSSPSS
mmetsp:Transcript_8552/g.20314  ORF Transcript_8552/g.20314 Transcript_8552/m.20314 type:complete len:215 (+) Transcript_8552:2592-3236(+)